MNFFMSPSAATYILFIVQLVLTFFIETYLLIGLLFGSLSVPWALFLHVLLCGALASTLFTSENIWAAGRWKTLLLLSVAMLGVAGFVGTLVSWLFTKIFSRFSTPFDQWYYSLFLSTAPSNGQVALSKRVHIKNGTMTDLFTVADIGEKERLLAEIARNYRPAHARCLRLALNDAAAPIRTLAASVVAKIEKSNTDDWLRMKADIQKKDIKEDTWFKLAEHLYIYAESGLLDADRQKEVMHAAKEAIDQSLAAKANNPVAFLLQGKILVRQGHYNEAIRLFDQMIARGDNSIAITHCRHEALFRAHRWSEISLEWQTSLTFDHLLEETSSSRWQDYLGGRQNVFLLR
jgi:polysaccharide biosynthesis protein PelE